MKKLLLVLTLLSATVLAHGQARFELGLKGGLNLSNISSDANASYNSRTGFHGGLYGMIKVANIGIQPELLYSQQGSEVNFDNAANDFKQDFVYMSIPVMVKFYLPLGLNLQAGPQFGAMLSADGQTLDGAGNPVDLSKDSYKNSDISAAFGAGWDAPFGLRIMARYVIGLNDINELSFGQETKNKMFQVSLGYALIKLGK